MISRISDLPLRRATHAGWPRRTRRGRRWLAAGLVALTAPVAAVGKRSHPAFATSDQQKLPSFSRRPRRRPVTSASATRLRKRLRWRSAAPGPGGHGKDGPHRRQSPTRRSAAGADRTTGDARQGPGRARSRSDRRTAATTALRRRSRSPSRHASGRLRRRRRRRPRRSHAGRNAGPARRPRRTARPAVGDAARPAETARRRAGRAHPQGKRPDRGKRRPRRPSSPPTISSTRSPPSRPAPRTPRTQLAGLERTQEAARRHG